MSGIGRWDKAVMRLLIESTATSVRSPFVFVNNTLMSTHNFVESIIVLDIHLLSYKTPCTYLNPLNCSCCEIDTILTTQYL